MAIKYLAGRRMQGTSAERTGKTFEEDFTNGATDVWSHAESSYTSRTGNELKFTHKGVQWADQTSSTYDLQTSLGSGTNASDTAWVLRGRMKSTLDSDQPELYFGLTDVKNEDDPNFGTNFIAGKVAAITATDRYLTVRDGTTQTTGSDYIVIDANTDYWFDLRRTNSTTATIKIYTSSSYTGSTIVDDDVTWSGSITGLRYIKLGKSPHGSGNSDNHVIFDDIEFYNGVTDPSTAGAGNVQTGAIFEETTGKHYIWNATSSTWSEIA